MTATAKKRSKAAQKAAQLARAEFRAVVFNLPNQLTWARLILAAVMFAVIAMQHYFAGMVLFIIAAGTDWLDGYFARKYNQVTTLGRILDPFADKVIICGTFIYLAAIADMQQGMWPSGTFLLPTMAVIVVGRELLVTALRSFIEQQGGDFSAQMSGKLKMVLQCIAAGVSLFYLSRNDGVGQQIVRFVSEVTYRSAETWLAVLQWAMIGFIWSAVVMTVWSGVGYVVTAVRLLRS
jgi:CDP-diacylglycerol--glycerol-3-phosphate 3-phosphatidyltransferase